MLDNEMFDKSIGVIFDGTGYGLDGKIWGSEFLVGDTKSFFRKGHFDYIKLLSGDLGIKQPYRVAVGFLYEEYKDKNLIKKFYEKISSVDKLPDFEDLYSLVKFLIDNKINIAEVCGIGRIFDVVGVFCGVGVLNYYEGQIPTLCEFYATKKFKEIKNKDLFYSYEIKNEDGIYVLNTRGLLKKIFEDVFLNSENIENVLAKFHLTLIYITTDILLKIRDELGINKIVISGGVFQNKIFFETLVDLLKKENFEVHHHKRFPTNDAGISAGQSLAASVDE
jgi:hydrogenase maturation protein HypF